MYFFSYLDYQTNYSNKFHHPPPLIIELDKKAIYTVITLIAVEVAIIIATIVLIVVLLPINM